MLDSATRSSSTIVRCFTPVRNRASAHHPPTPPTPKIATCMDESLSKVSLPSSERERTYVFFDMAYIIPCPTSYPKLNACFESDCKPNLNSPIWSACESMGSTVLTAPHGDWVRCFLIPHFKQHSFVRRARRSPLCSQGAVASLLVATPDRRWVCPNPLLPHPNRNRRDT